MVAPILGVISLDWRCTAPSYFAGGEARWGHGRFPPKHLLMLASGGLVVYWASRPKHGIYSRLSQLLLGLTAGLLLLTLLTGSGINDASRWLRIPLLGVVSDQRPGEGGAGRVRQPCGPEVPGGTGRHPRGGAPCAAARATVIAA